MNNAEIKKFIGPSIVAAGEVVATGAAVKSYLEGNPLSFNDLGALYGFWTFYIGVPAGIVATAVVHIVDRLKPKVDQFPKSPDFPQSPTIS